MTWDNSAKAGIMILMVLTQKMKPKEIKWFAPQHTLSQWPRENSNAEPLYHISFEMGPRLTGLECSPCSD